jgi:hypothetical protein
MIPGLPPMRIAAIALLSLSAACATGQPTIGKPRPLGAPVTGLKRLGDLFFTPAAMTTSLGHAVVSGKRVAAAEGARLKNIPPDLAAAPRAELARPKGVPETLRSAARSAEQRLPGIVTAVHALGRDARDDLVAVRHDLDRTPEYLQLDRPPLGEPDDRRHRTDAADDATPEASLLSRLLRRLLP